MSTLKLDGSEWRLGPAFGSGGFATVFEVTSAEGDRAVAKLFPKAPGADRELLFSGEGVRNVIPILDCGEHEGDWVIVMPRAEKSLRDHLDAVGGAVSEDEAAVILRDIVVALTDLHGDVVHRDLKPENVLLWEGRWCVADFGLARYAEAATGTNTRKGWGTWPYMAPEVWKFQRATIAADVYALGVIGYELLTGQWPFQGPYDHDFRDQHLQESPPRLTSVSPLLAAAVEECLYKPPQARPTPALMLDRLTRAAPASAGLAALAEANRNEVGRRAEAQRATAAGETEAERREELFTTAAAIHTRISELFRTALTNAAPTAEVENGRQGGWILELGRARLHMSAAHEAPAGVSGVATSMPIDVVAYATVKLEMVTPNHLGYQGRGHALWYCDAKAAGEYRWFETAFMPLPFQTERPTVLPYALGPGAEAARAVGPAMDVVQVAWPFTALDIADLDEFIERWATWLSAAASGRLEHPTRLPERPVDGSWRN
ncbi:serine/threonine-protein kinase [Embleya sp. NPDC005971]|uniref:serine/threonine-protein kinase n=1 Tax=Embleya sp. NPDC005971 TaxID=3156724 RepID=UPI003410BF3E